MNILAEASHTIRSEYEQRASGARISDVLRATDLETAQKHFMVFWDATYKKAVAYAIQRLPSKDIAEDVTHDVYMNMWELLHKKITDVPDYIITYPRAYLFQSLKRAIAGYYRSASKKPVDISLDIWIDNIHLEVHISDKRTPYTRLVEKQKRDVVNGVFRSFSPEKKELLLLRYQQELSIREIAKITDESVSAVKTKLHRIRQELIRKVRDAEKDI